MCVDTNAISKKPPLLIEQKPNNAQNTQRKLGVAFSYLKRNNYERSEQTLLSMGEFVNIIAARNMKIEKWASPTSTRE